MLKHTYSVRRDLIFMIFALGSIPLPSSLDSTSEWVMFINFGYNDPNVDISGVEFESVNAVDVTDAIPGIDRTK